MEVFYLQCLTERVKLIRSSTVGYMIVTSNCIIEALIQLNKGLNCAIYSYNKHIWLSD